MYACSVKLFYGNELAAKAAGNAIIPDLDSNHKKRSKIKVKVNKGILALNISASDPVALRASLNGSLKLIGLVQRVLEVG